MKKRIVGIISLSVLLIAYIVFRYTLFEWHGMGDFPLYLLMVGAVIIVISGIIKSGKITPVFTVTGYIVGFFGGHLFAADYYDPGGGRLNSMWIIWMISYAIAIIAGVIITTIFNVKKWRALNDQKAK